MSSKSFLRRAVGAALATAAATFSASAEEAPILSSAGYSEPVEPAVTVIPSLASGAYLRAEIGAMRSNADDGFWESPGPGDPTVFFDVDVDNGGVFGLALGYDWQNGLRGELALLSTGKRDVSGDCSDASNGTPCSDHADIESASLRTQAAMLNLYYAPWEAMGRSSRIQPFVTAGIGTARHEMGDWTRVNPAAGRPVRTFEGDTTTDFAWSVGAGLAMPLGTQGAGGAVLETTLRYYDFGTIKGGTKPLPGNGASTPREPFQFDMSSTVLSVAIRIPLRR